MMNSILNLFSDTNNLTKPTVKKTKNTPCGAKQADIQSYMPSLQQGKRFEKYQGQITKNLEKKIADMENEGIEGFQNGPQMVSDNGLTQQTRRVIDTNDFSSSTGDGSYAK
jgi:hypothetical protein